VVRGQLYILFCKHSYETQESANLYYFLELIDPMLFLNGQQTPINIHCLIYVFFMRSQ